MLKFKQPSHSDFVQWALSENSNNAHARRRFANAIKAAKKDLTDEQLRNTVAGQALERLGVIYKLEGGWKEQPSEYRLKMRNSVLKPLVEEYFSWAKEQIAKKTAYGASQRPVLRSKTAEMRS